MTKRIFLLLIKITYKTGQLPASLIFSLFNLSFKKHRRGWPKKIIVPLWARVSVLGFVVFSIFVFYTWSILTAAYQLPTPQRLAYQQQPLTTEFYDRSGVLLYRLYEGRNRSLAAIGGLPPYLLQATIAVEDKNFYKHNGVDFSAIARAIYHNYSKETIEGASTITQQLVKNSLLSTERTYARKIKEVILSLWAESIYSKEQILLMYLNNAPYGGTNWGVEAASQNYFGKSADNLTLAQSAYLAGLPASPSEYSPYGTKAELGTARQKEVLQKMVENKYISSQQAEKALSEELNIKPQLADIQAPHFVMYTKSYLEAKFGPLVVAQGGLKVYTTLDLGLQNQVQNIVSQEVDNLISLNVNNGAAMITDAKTGQILAMVGSRDYYYPDFGNYNVTGSLRQPGSAIKPVTSVPAFNRAYVPG